MQKLFITLISLIITGSALFSQDSYVPSLENLKNRSDFQDDKFGIFVHWGLYSMMANGEWIMHNLNLNHDEYSKLASGFYPSKFDANSWVKSIKESGAKYICFTTRHHDGFSLFDSQFSDYNIIKATPFKRDILKELSEACEKHEIKLHLYYSHLDWGREDYYPLGRTGLGTGRTKHGEWKTYYEFMNNQITELLTNYGNVRAIWFDGWWDHDIHPNFDWQLDYQYSLIHNINPGCLIGNNHHQKPFEGEDFQMFERDLPTENKSGLSGQEISLLPLETCETMNGSWGYRMRDTSYKSTKELIHYLVKAAGNNANLLLNVGPRPNGEIPEITIERLKEIGDWMKVYGESIYGTRGYYKPQEWGVITQKEQRFYIHILNLNEKQLYISMNDITIDASLDDTDPNVPNNESKLSLQFNISKIKSITNFIDQEPIDFTIDSKGILLKFNHIPNEIDFVIVINY